TAMLGVFFFVAFGWLDLSLVYYTDTNLIPQIVGGLILGVGFVIGGYCPGTSCVSAATGRIDGVVYLLGVMAGIFVFGEIFPWIENFYYSSNMGRVFLPDYLGLSYGMIVFLVVLMAVGAFAAAEWGERKMAAKKSGVSK
ncbi:MAG: YeeE/YedE family protein, partial [Ignavibacteria bacterium]|nr:YeeE/YedE family protein [Ignavibacteria bacterium]